MMSEPTPETLAEELIRRAARLIRANPPRDLRIGSVVISAYYNGLEIWVDHERAFLGRRGYHQISNRKACYEALKLFRTAMVLDELADV